MLRKLVDLITSLKLTIVCLAAAMVLIFAGTIAQVHLGIHEAQQRYFQSLFVWAPYQNDEDQRTNNIKTHVQRRLDYVFKFY